MAKKRKTTQKQTKAVKATRYTKHIPNPEEPTPAWELLKEPYEYSEKRSLRKTILVVCQSKEEAAYFKSFPIASLTVVPPREEEATPLDTVLYAQEIVKATAHDFDQVWCVCRTSPEQANSLEPATKKAHSLGYGSTMEKCRKTTNKPWEKPYKSTLKKEKTFSSIRDSITNSKKTLAPNAP